MPVTTRLPEKKTRSYPLEYCPERSPSVTAVPIPDSEQQWLLIHPENSNRLQLDSQAYQWWHLLDGTHSINALLQAGIEATGRWEPFYLQQFLHQLRDGQFLATSEIASHIQRLEREPHRFKQEAVWGAASWQRFLQGVALLLTPFTNKFVLSLFTFLGFVGLLLFLTQLPGLSEMSLSWATKEEWAALLLGLLLLPLLQAVVQGGFLRQLGVVPEQLRLRWNGRFPLLQFTPETVAWLPAKQQAQAAIAPWLFLLFTAAGSLFIEGISLMRGNLPSLWGMFSFAAWIYLFVESSPWLDGPLARAWGSWIDRPNLRKQTLPYLQRMWRQLPMESSRGKQHLGYAGYMAVYTLFLIWVISLLWQGQLRIWLTALWQENAFLGRLPGLAAAAALFLPLLYLAVRALIPYLIAKADGIRRMEWVVLIATVSLIFFFRYGLFATNSTRIWMTAVCYLALLALQLYWARQYADTLLGAIFAALAVSAGAVVVAYAVPAAWSALFVIAAVTIFMAAGMLQRQSEPWWPMPLAERVVITLVLLFGLFQIWGMTQFAQLQPDYPIWQWSSSLFISLAAKLFWVRFLLQYWRTRFFLPWLLLFLLLPLLPWLHFIPGLYLLTAVFWLFGMMLYSGAAILHANEMQSPPPPALAKDKSMLLQESNERFLHYFQARFLPYLGRIKLLEIEEQLVGLRPAEEGMMGIAAHGRDALLLLLDRLQKLIDPRVIAAAGEEALATLAPPQADLTAQYLLSQIRWGHSMGQRIRRQMQAQKVWLAQAPAFKPLPPPFLERLWARLRPETAVAGSMIRYQGEEADSFYLIESGKIRALRPGMPAVFLGPGAYFGEAALNASGQYEADYEAMVDCVLLRLDRAAFVSLRQTDALLARPFLQAQKQRALLADTPLLANWLPAQRAQLLRHLQHRELGVNGAQSLDGASWCLVLEGEINGVNGAAASLRAGEATDLQGLFAEADQSAETAVSLSAEKKAALWLLDRQGWLLFWQSS